MRMSTSTRCYNPFEIKERYHWASEVERTDPYLDDGVDETVSLRSAEKPDGALLNDVVVDPARHGDGPRAAGDDHVGQEEALGQISTRE